MVSKNIRREIKDIYIQLMGIINSHNQRIPRISTFKNVLLIPFSNRIVGKILSTNRHDGPESYGFEIILDAIEGNQKFLSIKMTPIKITLELWDNDKRELAKESVDKFNGSNEPFNNVRGVNKEREYKLIKPLARIDNKLGLQFVGNYRYNEFSIEDIWRNIANVSQYADLSSAIIQENYIA